MVKKKRFVFVKTKQQLTGECHSYNSMSSSVPD